MKNEYLYGVIGLLVGIIATSGLYAVNSNHRGGYASHRMHDGTMMSNDEMMGMEHQMDAMTMSLAGKTGDEFDKEFLTQMIVHHEGAVVMANEALQVSKRPELLKLSAEIISAQEKEISQMKGWLSDWFGQ